MFVIIQSCNNTSNPKKIIDQAIEFSGGESYDNSSITFEFRDKSYSSKKHDNYWEMSRSFSDSLGIYKDTHSSKGFQRTINDSITQVHDSMAFKYIESINSVFYFALLPYKLNDKAVISEYLGQEKIEGTSYFKIRIRFNEEGGGVDHEDEFIYWFDTKDYSLDFLAYSFQVNGGGKRFRKAYNERVINGIRFADYENYKPEDDSKYTLEQLAHAFTTRKLKLLSTIELKKIKVN